MSSTKTVAEGRCPHGHSNRIMREMLGVDTEVCITWPYQHTKWGYGTIWVDGHTDMTHRVAWIWTFGAIPDNLHVLHRCDNPPCFNPRHLFLGTNLDNHRDMKQKGRSTFGINNAQAKLSDDDVRSIRALYSYGKSRFGEHAIAKHFGVSRIAVRKIVRGEAWTHVK